MRWRWLIPVSFIALWQITYYTGISNFVPLAVPLLVLPLYRRKYVGDRKWPYSIALSGIFAAFLIVPAILSKTIEFSFVASAFLNSIYYSGLLSITLLPTVFATILDGSRKDKFGPMLLCGIAYFLVLTPIRFSYTTLDVVKLLLYNVSFDFAFSVFISYLYLAENRKLVGPTLFFFIYSVFSFLDLSERVSQLFNLVWEIISISILFWIAYFLLGENIWVRRLLKTKRRIKVRRRVTKSDVAFSAVLVIIGAGALGGYVTHTVSADPTSSMYPVIVPGSMLFVMPQAPSSVKLGEIIEFHSPWANGTLFAHKVVNIVDKNGTIYFRTRGVNNPVDDPQYVPGSDLVGQVVYHVPYLGYLFIYAKLTAAVLISILVGAVLLEGSVKGRKR